MRLNNVHLIAKNFPSIDHIFFDFDGVFTPNTVIVDQNGKEAIQCSRSDGIGLAKLKALSMNMSILSSEINPIVLHRAKKLGIDVNSNVDNKLKFAQNFCKQKNINLKNIIFVGNDENDLDLILKVGVSFGPADSWSKIIESVDFVTLRNGGYGCVREICEFLFQIMRVKNEK